MEPVFIDQFEVDSVVSYIGNWTVFFDPEDEYFWMHDHLNPELRKYNMVKRLKKFTCLKKSN